MALAASIVTPVKPATPSKPPSEPGRRAQKAFTTLPVIDVAALLDSSKSQARLDVQTIAQQWQDTLTS